MAVCDGCGAEVDDAHIRRRIERLELATRFRPIHISVLLVDAGPPAHPEDYFYRAASERSARSAASRAFFDGLMVGAGIAADPPGTEESALAEFQRRGFFLVGAIECPPNERADAGSAIRQGGLALVRRIRGSYKPKAIALLSAETEPLIPVFQQTEWGARLILDGGAPFALPLSPGRLAMALGPAGRY